MRSLLIFSVLIFSLFSFAEKNCQVNTQGQAPELETGWSKADLCQAVSGSVFKQLGFEAGSIEIEVISFEGPSYPINVDVDGGAEQFEGEHVFDWSGGTSYLKRKD